MGLTTNAGETQLATLLAYLHPVLHPDPFVFVTLPRDGEIPPNFASLFQEEEGISLILIQADADRHRVTYSSVWALITLQLQSSLAAVGLLATLLPPLAAAGISVNPVAAFHHDHLFVPWDRRTDALQILSELERPVGN